MSNVADILKNKPNTVYSIEPQATVYAAVAKMVEHNVGSLLVIDGGKLRGIITERDYLRQIVLKDRSSKNTAVVDIMSSNLIYVEPSANVEECMAIMTQKHIRHLPVLENGALVGIISVGDMVKQLSHDQQVHIQYLTDFIADRYPG